MTNRVRIENANQAEYPLPIMIQVQEVNAEGKWYNSEPPIMLSFPAQLLELHIHQNKRFIVYEFQTGNA